MAPIFFVVLFGIVEAGRFMFYYETLNNATREGARYAIVNGAKSLTCSTGPAAPNTTSCDPDGSDVATGRVQRHSIVRSAITVTPTWTPDNGRGSTVSVRARFTYSSLIRSCHCRRSLLKRSRDLLSTIRRFVRSRDERGQILVLFAGGLIVLFIVAALVRCRHGARRTS